MHNNSIIEGIVELVRSGLVDVDSISQAAANAWFAWDALHEIDPQCAASIPRPKRKRGRDRFDHSLRNFKICFEVEYEKGSGVSQRAACALVFKRHSKSFVTAQDV